MYFTAKDSTNWQQTPGLITFSKNVSTRSSSGSGYTRTPVIHYRYEVRDRTYTGKLARYGLTGTSDVRKYPVGKQVTVYYDPWNPEKSVLETGLFVATFILPLLGAVIFFGSLAAGYLTNLGRRARECRAKR